MWKIKNSRTILEKKLNINSDIDIKIKKYILQSKLDKKHKYIVKTNKSILDFDPHFKSAG